MTNLIRDDIARCLGEKLTSISPCINCSRRMQIAIDEDETAMYPMMAVEPINGKCVYKIMATKRTTLEERLWMRLAKA